jgi:four helix bundle protein
MAVAHRLEDLVVWQLSVELRDRILALTRSSRPTRDRDFIEQIEDSAGSSPRNLAEGFGYFNPRQFAKYARIARGSLLETLNHLQDGRRRGYFPARDLDELVRLTGRTIAAVTSLLRYLDSCKGKAPTGWDVAALNRRS